MPKIQEGKDYDLDFDLLHLSVRWNTVLFPFEQRRFFTLLPGEGYLVEEAALQRPRFGMSVEVSGPIARKGKTTLGVDTGRLLLALEAEDERTLVDEFGKIEELLKSQLFFDSPEHAYFYELLSEGAVWSRQDPMQAITKALPRNDVLSQISQVVGTGALDNFTLHLIESGAEPCSPSWLDLRIEPSVRSPHNVYRFSLVYRKPERTAVVKLARGLTQVITSAIQILERFNE